MLTSDNTQASSKAELLCGKGLVSLSLLAVLSTTLLTAFPSRAQMSAGFFQNGASVPTNNSSGLSPIQVTGSYSEGVAVRSQLKTAGNALRYDIALDVKNIELTGTPMNYQGKAVNCILIADILPEGAILKGAASAPKGWGILYSTDDFTQTGRSSNDMDVVWTDVKPSNPASIKRIAFAYDGAPIKQGTKLSGFSVGLDPTLVAKSLDNGGTMMPCAGSANPCAGSADPCAGYTPAQPNQVVSDAGVSTPANAGQELTNVVEVYGGEAGVPASGALGVEETVLSALALAGMAYGATETIFNDNDGRDEQTEEVAQSLSDFDNDGIPDDRDLDDDNDGIEDIKEGDGAVDSDGDGAPDSKDTDSNNDGIKDGEPIPEVIDTDGDGIPDDRDLDDDNDGIPDTEEGGGRVDTDGDGIPDSMDLDSDNDGINDVVESGQEDLDKDGDGQVDGPVGENGLPDAAETKPETGETEIPVDTDGDGTSDYQDLDSNNDGIFDVVDGGGSDPDKDGIVGEGTPTDSDGDGIADGVDGSEGFGDAPTEETPSEELDTDGDGIPDSKDTDDDGDGIPDTEEGDGKVDSDKDGIPDSKDTDSNNDGTPDGETPSEEEPVTDTDGDGIDDIKDTDDDNDGIPDTKDTDDDGDGIPDSKEGGGNEDSDKDGIPDSIDPIDNTTIEEGTGGEDTGTGGVRPVIEGRLEGEPCPTCEEEKATDTTSNELAQIIPSEPDSAAVAPRANVTYEVGSAGTEGVGSIGGFIPLTQEAGENLTFLEGGVQLDNGANVGTKVELGYRQLNEEQSNILGAHVGYALRNTDDNTFNQISAGVESLGKVVDVRLDGFLPVGDSKQSVGSADETLQGVSFVGNDLLLDVQSSQKTESAMAGADLDVAFQVAEKVKFHTGTYFLTGNDESTVGVRGGVTAKPTDSTIMGLAVQHDGLFGTNVGFNIGYEFGGAPKGEGSSSSEATRLASRLGESLTTARPGGSASAIRVLSKTESESTQTSAINPDTGEAYVFEHVTDAGTTDGVGTFEAPRDSVKTATEAAAVNADNGVVYDQRTLSAVEKVGDLVIPDGIRVLSAAPEQKVTDSRFGEITLPGSGTGIRPTLEGAVKLSDRSTLSGFEIDATDKEVGIEATEVTKVTIENNRVLGASEAGILLDGVTDAKVANNEVETTDADKAIKTANVPEDANLEIADNTVTVVVEELDTDGDGIPDSKDTDSNNNGILDGQVTVEELDQELTKLERETSLLETEVVEKEAAAELASQIANESQLVKAADDVQKQAEVDIATKAVGDAASKLALFEADVTTASNPKNEGYKEALVRVNAVIKDLGVKDQVEAQAALTDSKTNVLATYSTLTGSRTEPSEDAILTSTTALATQRDALAVADNAELATKLTEATNAATAKYAKLASKEWTADSVVTDAVARDTALQAKSVSLAKVSPLAVSLTAVEQKAVDLTISDLKTVEVRASALRTSLSRIAAK